MILRLFSSPSRTGRLSLLILSLSLLAFAACSAKKEIRPEGDFDPEKTLARANELLDKKEYEDARRLLLEVKNRDLTKKFAPLAQLKFADSYAKEEEYELAVDEYRKFLDMYPDHKNASYAQYQIGMIYFSLIESPEQGYGAAAKALTEFEKLKQAYPRNPYKELVEVRIEKARNTIADYEFLVAEYYFKKDSFSAALGRFQTLLEKFPEYRKLPVVYYHMALCFKKTGKPEKAREFLTRLVEKYPDDKLVKDARKELAALPQ